MKTKWLISTFVALALCVASKAQQHTREYISSSFAKNRLTLNVSDGKIILTPYSEHSIEVLFIADSVPNPFPSEAIAQAPFQVKVEHHENKHHIVLSGNHLSVRVDKSPFKISYLHHNQVILSEENGFFADSRRQGFRFNLKKDEVLMGGGERVLGMNRRGQRLQLYNKASYGYQTHADLMYYSMPLVISSEKYMLGFDNGASGWLDLGKTEPDILQFEALGGRMSYFIVVGDSWQNLSTNFTELTGRQPQLPRWALGNISSRMGYHSQAEVESVIDQYRKDDIPLDAIVLDLYWFGPDVTGHMGNLEWYRDSFPHPEQMLRRNKKKGVKTILITEPFILKNSGKYAECASQNLLGLNADGQPYIFDFFFGTTALLDIFKPEAQQWFWNIYKKHTLSGVDGWWGDLGEPEVHPNDLLHVNGRADEVHNLYGHQWAKTIYNGYLNDFKEQRPVILMRAGFIGSQRYGLVPWSGDVSRSWGGLQSQVEISLQMGLQGLAYMHSDLGGFAGNYKDAELYTRWLQYGTFQPIYRTHAQEDVPPEPIFWDDSTKDIVRDYIRLRYQLTPYLYTLMHENSTRGLPLMRPLFYLEDNPELYDETATYLWGNDILVSPVVENGIKSQSVYLPANQVWINYFTGEEHQGGQHVNVPVDINTIPVFIRAGAFIPMVPPVNNMEAYNTDELNVHYYHAETVKKGEGYMYEDDGKTPDSFTKKQYELLSFECHNGSNLQFHFTPKGYDYHKRPKRRTVELIIHNYTPKTNQIIIDEQTFSIDQTPPNEHNTKQHAFYDEENSCLHIKFYLQKQPVTIITE
ncbi:TIM-barrel domain-containing protein [Carboxylicivirga taeanensis]|uniref:glycoside hydrolase family 31 protein n=1 Tax=Carboxylicivirga taeanensis TaxID=1416875 RepID=UPI003F6DC3A2